MIAVGFAIMTAGYLIVRHLASAPHYQTELLPAMVLIGVGIGMCFPALNLQATHSLPRHEQGVVPQSCKAPCSSAAPCWSPSPPA